MTGPFARGSLRVLEQRRAGALLVAAVVQLADELVDEVAAVGEDQDAAGARGLDEADRGDRLAGAGRVLEPEAARGARVLRLLGELLASSSSSSLGGRVPVDRLVVLGDLLVALELLLAGGQLLDRRLAVPVRTVPLAVLALGEQRDQGAGQRVDLVRVERRAVGEVRLVVGEQPLEAEHQRVLAPPLDRGLLAPRLDLGQRVVERAPAGRALRPARPRAILALVHERLERELLGAAEVLVADRRLRRY